MIEDEEKSLPFDERIYKLSRDDFLKQENDQDRPLIYSYRKRNLCINLIPESIRKDKILYQVTWGAKSSSRAT